MDDDKSLSIQNEGDTDIDSLEYRSRYVDTCFDNTKSGIEGKKIPKLVFYVSDIHIKHRLSVNNIDPEDTSNYIRTIVEQYLLGDLIVAGDISDSPELVKEYLDALDTWNRWNFIILGNHEYWRFDSVKEAEDYYSALCTDRNILLCNSLAYLVDGGRIPSDFQFAHFDVCTLSYEELCTMSMDEISDRLAEARYVIFGGTGFAGYNKQYNAECGLYRDALSRYEEIQETLKFEKLYYKLLPVLQKHEAIVATHFPKRSWCEDKNLDENITYVSGHTHRNMTTCEGSTRVYEDNQIGYKQKKVIYKCFYTDVYYDMFEDKQDGIHEISSDQYVRFLRGINRRGQFNRKNYRIFMLKKCGYYMFIARNKNDKFFILNGGALRTLVNPDLNYYYDNLLQMVDKILSPLSEYEKYMHKVSDYVRSLGYRGHIHGSIVDIDYYSHVYVDSRTLRCYPYFATSMVHKIFYPSLDKLIEAVNPEVLTPCEDLVSYSKMDITVYEIDNPVPYTGTEMYQRSREIYKMQKVKEKFLTVWYDHILDNEIRVNAIAEEV